MSDALYSTVLHFEGRGGVAKLHGRRVILTEAPQLPGLLLAGIDYVPEIGRRLVQTAERWRDMTGDEIRAADAVLRALVQAAQRAAAAPQLEPAPGAR